MIRIVVYAGAIAVIGAGLVSQGATATPALPFYDSADLTPRWAQSSGHRIADFALTTQTGAAITRRDLVGNVHVASFIYTRCAGICPAMVTQLSKVQAAVDSSADSLSRFPVAVSTNRASLPSRTTARRPSSDRQTGQASASWASGARVITGGWPIKALTTTR